jgi:hypothetical protein
LSWIIQDLWKSLDEQRAEYEDLLNRGKFEGYAAINRIATNVGTKWGVVIQVNFPPGRKTIPERVGRQDLSILVNRERRKFEGVTSEQLAEAIRQLDPVAIENMGYGHEGYKIRTSNGRIDCLAGGVHLWCEITPQVSRFLDWLFPNAYGLKPSGE